MQEHEAMLGRMGAAGIEALDISDLDLAQARTAAVPQQYRSSTCIP